MKTIKQGVLPLKKRQDFMNWWKEFFRFLTA